jgi:hypothetical protein
MSNEVSVAEPLSGSEIVESVCARVREQLRRDCFLSPNSAYEYFTGEIHIKIKAIDVGREADVEKTVVVTLGTVPAVDDPRVSAEHSEEEIPRAAPNVVRREAGLSVPVQTEDGTGKVESRRVKYAKPGEEKAQK